MNRNLACAAVLKDRLQRYLTWYDAYLKGTHG
jgi:hypothetical protein